MIFAAITVGILVALGIVGFVTYRFLNQRDDDDGGFYDWVKNPSGKQSAADYFAMRESLEVPGDISEDAIQKMVDRLFVQEDEDFNFDRLELVGEKAVPMLIAALESPKTASTRFGEGGHSVEANSPFERIVDLLQPIGPASAAASLARYIDHEDDHFRKHAAIAIGNIGTTECIAPMLKALDDDDDYVRSYAMMGIERGMDADRCTEEFLNAIFPALTKLLTRGDDPDGDTAPALLLAIDAERAVPVLLSPEYFSIENEQVHQIIRALNAAGHPIPHDTLLPFLNAIKPLSDKFPHDYEYAEALIAYARNPDASAEQVFRTGLKSSNNKVQVAAAEALAILAGVTNAREVVFDAMDDHGFDDLSQPQKHYYAVFIYDAEVNNGGHSQYFVNSSGDHWKSALDGLTAIGATARAEILHNATVLFGQSGPPVDNDPRHRQLARFSRQQFESLEELDSRYYECDENIEALLARYAINNKEHFRVQT